MIQPAPSAGAAAREARREEIVAAAAHHFRQYGYAKTTVGDLAAAIGFSTAYVYKFFASKQAIGEAVCALCLTGIVTDLQRIVSSCNSASDQLRAVFTALAAHARAMALQDTRLQELVVAAHEGGWQPVETHAQALGALLMQIVADGRRAGEFERETPIEVACSEILLVLECLRNPTLWAQWLDELEGRAASLAALVLRSLTS